MLLWYDNSVGECWENTREACKTLGYASSYAECFSYMCFAYKARKELEL